jgi:predicted transglutaminase-like cysteine proteinase
MRNITAATAASIPLLRPDFDAIGGRGVSSISHHALVGHPSWEHFKSPTMSPGMKSIDTIYTGDPFTGLFLQIRHSVPLESLVQMIRSGRQKYRLLDNAKKDALSILPAIDENMTPSPTEVDEVDPDIIHMSFHWKFRPKGSGNETEYTILLDVSRSRFEHYRRLQRFRGEWNKYAEAELPEIRTLALEFQKLHAQHKWNTFNQALNILTFVQSCIPYTYDKDTTGHEDWARYPIETLVDRTGDCEDVAILCAAIIARLGFQVVLLLYPRHLAFGVAGADKLKGEYVRDPNTGKHYYYGEATASGWNIGQIPSEYRNIPPLQILPINILINEDEEN